MKMMMEYVCIVISWSSYVHVFSRYIDDRFRQQLQVTSFTISNTVSLSRSLYIFSKTRQLSLRQTWVLVKVEHYTTTSTTEITI